MKFVVIQALMSADVFSIGTSLRDDFESSLPSSYCKPLGKKVKNMATSKRKIRSAQKEDVDTGMLLTKV